MNSKNRIQMLLSFEEPDRIGLADGCWEDTLLRWREEGLPAGVAPRDYFGFDFAHIFMDASLRLPERLLEDTETYTVREDKHGFVAKQWRGKAGALGYLDHRIKSREDWEQLKYRLAVGFGGTSRIHTVSYFQPFVEYPSWTTIAAKFQEMRQGGRFILLNVYGPWEATWRRHGFEASLIDMAADPGWMADMFRAHMDLIIETLEVAERYGIVARWLVPDRRPGYEHGTVLFPAYLRNHAFSRAPAVGRLFAGTRHALLYSHRRRHTHVHSQAH